MGRKNRPRKVTDYETVFPCAGGIGILREEVWMDTKRKVVRYNLAFIVPHLSAIDHGRVLGYDNAYGVHERHALGESEPAEYTSYPATARRFFREEGGSGGAMKVRIFTDGFEGHVRRSLDRARRMDRGERLEPEKIVTFADPAMMAECLSAQRVRLVETARKKKMSISALAEELGRNRGSVTRDVNKLRKHGLVRLREQVNPGHGVVRIVEPVARKIELRAEL